MKDKSYLRALFEWNKWSNEVTYRMVADLPPEEVTKKRPTPLESIHVSLNHLLNVDHIWLCHMKGEPHGLEGIRQVRFEDFGDLRAARKAMDETLLAYVDGLEPDALEETVEYELIGGNKGSLSRAMCLTHLVTHGAYHRGWISDMFGQAGAMQPSIDIPVYERAIREGGLPPLP